MLLLSLIAGCTDRSAGASETGDACASASEIEARLDEQLDQVSDQIAATDALIDSLREALGRRKTDPPPAPAMEAEPQ